MKSALCGILAVLVLAPSPAEAQRRNPPPRGQVEEAPALAPGEVLNMLDAYAVLQAQNALQLGDQQYGEFIPRLKRLQQARRRHHVDRLAIIQELRRLTNPQVAQVDEAAVREQLRKLRDLDDRAAAEIRAAYDALDQVLDPRQQARFRILEENLERRKLDLLMRARRGAATGRGR